MKLENIILDHKGTNSKVTLADIKSDVDILKKTGRMDELTFTGHTVQALVDKILEEPEKIQISKNAFDIFYMFANGIKIDWGYNYNTFEELRDVGMFHVNHTHDIVPSEKGWEMINKFKQMFDIKR